ncbi:GumC family protein [Roseovarius sp. Pro17]|uniref:GumC family protein n=1 Tax=Roseovarius sp. Pro17 TaxID=3108175 RepID=UPI002D79E046|nr:GumC family protein [Roseovarius sp. Pro17]
MSDDHEIDDRLSDKGVVDVGRVIGNLLRGWVTILGAALIVSGIAALTTLTMPDQFSAVARIIIEPEQSKLTGFSASEAIKPVSEAMIESNAEIIQSNRVLEQVVKELSLQENEVFLGAPDDLADAPNVSGIADMPSRLALKKLSEVLTIRPVGSSMILSIRATTEDPLLSAEIANTVAEKFILAEQKIKVDQAQAANLWLIERLTDLQSRVSGSSRKLETFRTQTGDMTERQVTETSRLLFSLERELEQRQAQSDRATRESLETRIENTKAELVDLTSSIVTLNELERQASADSVLYERLLERAREMQELETFQVSSVRIVSDALPPLEKSAPARKLIVLLCFVLGGAIGAGIVILREAN